MYFCFPNLNIYFNKKACLNQNLIRSSHPTSNYKKKICIPEYKDAKSIIYLTNQLMKIILSQ